MMKKLLIISLLGISWINLSNPYKSFFTSDYDRAIGILEDNAIHFYHICSETNIDSKIARSIIFPEVIRFNTLQNFLEEKALELLYIDKGTDAVDFSIGYFQMKPSFIETLEQDIKTDSVLNNKYHKLNLFTSSNPKKIRKERLERLQNIDWQITYLCALIDILTDKYNQDHKSKKEQVILFGSAYNYGFKSSKKNIENWSKVKAFPYGRDYTGKQFTYSEIALHYFLKQ